MLFLILKETTIIIRTVVVVWTSIDVKIVGMFTTARRAYIGIKGNSIQMMYVLSIFMKNFNYMNFSYIMKIWVENLS